MRAGVLLAAMLGCAVCAPAQAETIAVAINNVAYAPTEISARVGDTIVWTNNDIVAHTATARDKSWDYNILPKKTTSMTVNKAGTIEYFCRYHPNMVGHIAVKE
ncbi:MAG: cupredoxin domain-containing protein [Pseudolabrys sp.]|nr:cupredoxin domain-containing protein [Pseudolabrys sp.]